MICHVTITTAQQKQTVAFYQWLLDLPIVKKINTPNGEIIFLGEAQTKLEIIADSSAKKINTKSITVGFKVDNLDKKIALLESRQIPHTAITTVPNARFAFFTDLNGCNIQLFEGQS